MSDTTEQTTDQLIEELTSSNAALAERNRRYVEGSVEFRKEIDKLRELITLLETKPQWGRDGLRRCDTLRAWYADRYKVTTQGGVPIPKRDS